MTDEGLGQRTLPGLTTPTVRRNAHRAAHPIGPVPTNSDNLNVITPGRSRADQAQGSQLQTLAS